ncbi:MAG: hypothetical protein WDO06_04340 [Actinomycetota bacterium]
MPIWSERFLHSKTWSDEFKKELILIPLYHPSLCHPPVVETFPGAASDCTVIEVRSHDQPGLLFRIGDALTVAALILNLQS